MFLEKEYQMHAYQGLADYNYKHKTKELTITITIWF